MVYTTQMAARIPHLTPQDFFLSGILKGPVYEKNPLDLSTLKSRMKCEIAKVTEAQLSDILKT